MKKIHIILFLFFTIISCKNDSSQLNLGAIVYFNGDIITMKGNSPVYAEALIVKNKKIQFVGSLEEAMKIAGNGHQMINLKGKTLLPGFIDGHAHFASFSAQAIGAKILPPPDAGAKNIATLIKS